MQTSGVSLRDRQRTATWQAIHEAAYQLVDERGLSSVTVEEIVAAAGVSQRTFFNYFPSKEDAVLGLRTPSLPDEVVDRFRRGEDGDLFSRVVHLLAGVFRSTAPSDSWERVHHLVERYPEMRKRVVHYVGAAEQLVQDYVAGRWKDEHPRPPDGVDTPEKARALVMVAGAVLRYASFHKLPATAAERDNAINQAIATFREVIQQAL